MCLSSFGTLDTTFLICIILPLLPNEPKPLKFYSDLSKEKLIEIKPDLLRKSGVYGVINTIDGGRSQKRYIGSGKDLYRRLNDHFKGRQSNVRLQRAIKKYGWRQPF